MTGSPNTWRTNASILRRCRRSSAFPRGSASVKHRLRRYKCAATGCTAFVNAERDVHDRLLADIKRKRVSRRRMPPLQNSIVPNRASSTVNCAGSHSPNWPVCFRFPSLWKLCAVTRFTAGNPARTSRRPQHMNADIDQRPAALERFIGENAPPRHTATTQRLRGGEVTSPSVPFMVRRAGAGIQRKAMVKTVRRTPGLALRDASHPPGAASSPAAFHTSHDNLLREPPSHVQNGTG